MLSLILVVGAFVLFLLAGLLGSEPVEPRRGKLLCFGLACLAGAEILVRATSAGLLH